LDDVLLMFESHMGIRIRLREWLVSERLMHKKRYSVRKGAVY
jgi:hypothetical protein